MNDDQLLRYSRHILLDDIGIGGQNAFLNAHVLVVGAGGLGCVAALYLASSGVGYITILDGDVVDETNLQRQIAHRESDIGRNKAYSVKDAIQRINSHVDVVALPVHADLSFLLNELSVNDIKNTNINIKQQQRHVDVVLDCTDNFQTRQNINLACVAKGVPLVTGSAMGMDGQLSAFSNLITGKNPYQTGCYACLFPPQHAPTEANCASMGVFAPLVGIVGSAQAAQALLILNAQTTTSTTPLFAKLLMVNARNMQWQEIRYTADENCSVCGTNGVSKTQGM